MELKGEKVVKKFKGVEFDQIPKRHLIDIVRRIHTDNPNDNEILKTWEKHFKGQDVPYAITQSNGIKTLWKERVI